MSGTDNEAYVLCDHQTPPGTTCRICEAALPRREADERALSEPIPQSFLRKRPVAFRVRHGNGWIILEDENGARMLADSLGVDYQGLYVRDGIDR